MPQVLESCRVENPLSVTAPKTAGVIHEVVKFVDDGQYLFFALVSRGWRDAWGKRTATTSYVKSYTSVSQMQYGFKCGLPRKNICAAAARVGNMEILRFARSSGFPWNSVVCTYAALGGHLEVLQWARSNGCGWCTSTCYGAARAGRLEVLQWSRANGCEWDATTCFEAEWEGHLEVLQWARANGCKG